MDGELSEEEMKDIHDENDWKFNQEILRRKEKAITISPEGTVQFRQKADILKLSLEEKKEKNEVERILELVEKNFEFKFNTQDMKLQAMQQELDKEKKNNKELWNLVKGLENKVEDNQREANEKIMELKAELSQQQKTYQNQISEVHQ